jgi:hypothetical protein
MTPELLLWIIAGLVAVGLLGWLWLWRRETRPPK